MKLSDLKTKIFADGADPLHIYKLAADPLIAGFTTNPTLMKVAGIKDYEAFAKELLAKVPDRPISLEVFSDDLTEMQRQGFKLGSWGKNVYVKVPVTNSRGETTVPVIKALAKEGIKLNVTALFTLDQLITVHKALNPEIPSVLSVFAGRISDTGRDACQVMRDCRKYLGHGGKAELLWASSREVYNLVQANETGCDIITMSPDLLKKLSMYGKDLVQLSLETVNMFKNDAAAAGYQL
ncbi:transaldolase [bacterium]|nr:transaldolase [bacterium]